MVRICLFVAILKNTLIGSKSTSFANTLHIFNHSTLADPLNRGNCPPKTSENYCLNVKILIV